MYPLVLCSLRVEVMEDIWYLSAVVMAAGSSTDVYYTVPSFQADCMFSWVGGERVYKCANSVHYVASFLQEILLFAAISDLKDGGGKKWQHLTQSPSCCVLGDLLTAGLQMHLYSFFLVLPTADSQRSGERI